MLSKIVWPLFSLTLLIAASCSVVATHKFAGVQDPNEYAPLEHKVIKYVDWNFKSLSDGAPVNLRSLLVGKKLVMVVYFAPWCSNWRHEMALVAKLYDSYKADGFDVIGVSEYSHIEEINRLFGEAGSPYTVVVESESRDARTVSSHYAYRSVSGDSREWGSPWHIFIEPNKIASAGEFLLTEAWVANGELIEADVDSFIRSVLYP